MLSSSFRVVCQTFCDFTVTNMLTEALRVINVAVGSFADSHHVVNLLGRPFLALLFNNTEEQNTKISAFTDMFTRDDD